MTYASWELQISYRALAVSKAKHCQRVLCVHVVFQAARPNVTTLTTRCSAIADRPRCRVRYSFHQK